MDEEQLELLRKEWSKTSDELFDWFILNMPDNNNPHPIHFGRWILKNAYTKTTKDFCVCWERAGEELDTHELFKQFIDENPQQGNN
jgi:hypothetical protein